MGWTGMQPDASRKVIGMDEEPSKYHHSFSEIARHTADALGSACAFAAACMLVLAWAVAGPIFQFSDA
jgi:hypothetical protein